MISPDIGDMHGSAIVDENLWKSLISVYNHQQHVPMRSIYVVNMSPKHFAKFQACGNM